jgi:ATP-dependent DNA helicase DinG
MSLRDDVLRLLAEDGPVARRLAGFAPRPAQLEMAAATADALEDGDGRLVVEAGTGTGKSLAYLASAVLYEGPVAVATGTKALQDQLIERDLPLVIEAVQEMTGKERRAALMKGRANYLCVLRYDRFAKQPRFLFREDAGAWPALEKWAQVTETGDRAELDTLPDGWSTWSELDSGADTCLGGKCPDWERCWVVKMRRRAQDADIVVANHHLLCADARVRLEGMPESSQTPGEDPGRGSYGQVLPDVDALIVDEAHSLPDVASEYFGVQLASSRIERLVRDTKGLAERLPAEKRLPLLGSMERAQEALASVFDAVAPLAEAGERTRLDDPPADARDLARLAADSFGELTQRLDGVTDDAEAELSADGAFARALVRRADQIVQEAEFLLTAAPSDPRFVSFVEPRRRGLALCATPIDVADALAQTLFADARPLVLTSATLAVEGSCDGFVARSGIAGLPPAAGDDDLDDDNDDNDPIEVEQLVLPSPFDHEQRAALYAPADFPSPDAPDYAARFCDEVRWLCELTGAGALLLFTSYRALERAYETLHDELAAEGPVLRQGEAPRGRLLDQMREQDGERGAVLFATLSFWEGVDVPGRALRLVVIDRLPFRSPGDPVFQARGELVKERGGHPFMDLSLPEAALTLKQGAGRLLRTTEDAGIVAVLDGRLRKKRYGRTFLQTLPPMTRIGSRKALGSFWERFCAPALGLDA